MNNILHVICLLFTLLITLWCVHKYKEGFNDNTLFTECRNNTEWYVENEEGERFYCDDIGNGASCYDMNERYVEGWEVCHRSCGNCRDTQVTTSNQQQLAGYYGDSNDFFGIVLFRDEDRNWVGTDERSEGESMDEDTQDMTNRLGALESLYDLLFTESLTCHEDCSDYDTEELCTQHDVCDYTNDECVNNVDETSGNQFISCDGHLVDCSAAIDDEVDRSYISRNSDGQLALPATSLNCGDVQSSFENAQSYSLSQYLSGTILPSEIFTNNTYLISNTLTSNNLSEYLSDPGQCYYTSEIEAGILDGDTSFLEGLFVNESPVSLDSTDNTNISITDENIVAGSNILYMIRYPDVPDYSDPSQVFDIIITEVERFYNTNLPNNELDPENNAYRSNPLVTDAGGTDLDFQENLRTFIQGIFDAHTIAMDQYEGLVGNQYQPTYKDLYQGLFVQIYNILQPNTFTLSNLEDDPENESVQTAIVNTLESLKIKNLGPQITSNLVTKIISYLSGIELVGGIDMYGNIIDGGTPSINILSQLLDNRVKFGRYLVYVFVNSYTYSEYLNSYMWSQFINSEPYIYYYQSQELSDLNVAYYSSSDYPYDNESLGYYERISLNSDGDGLVRYIVNDDTLDELDIVYNDYNFIYNNTSEQLSLGDYTLNISKDVGNISIQMSQGSSNIDNDIIFKYIIDPDILLYTTIPEVDGESICVSENTPEDCLNYCIDKPLNMDEGHIYFKNQYTLADTGETYDSSQTYNSNICICDEGSLDRSVIPYMNGIPIFTTEVDNNNITEYCKNYFLLDTLVDDSDSEIRDRDYENISLLDYCPQACGVCEN